MTRILIAEDDSRIASFIEKGLRASGYATHVVGEGDEVARLLERDEFELVILDIGLPDRDGFDVLRTLRRHGTRVPVIILTARRDRDVVAYLEGGADDYMEKPFRFEELLARIRRRLRTPDGTHERVLSSGDLRLDVLTRRATIGERRVDLTGREFALLETLLRHADQVLTREQLLSHVWGYDFDPGSNVVNVYVNSLRRKLGPDVIDSVRGVGYRLPLRKEVLT
jgi:two-component system, OmpR family, copper resistance phosphate regulon response regulator CusR